MKLIESRLGAGTMVKLKPITSKKAVSISPISLSINKIYTEPHTIQQIKNHTQKQGNILLQNAISNIAEVQKAISNIKLKEQRDPIHYHYYSQDISQKEFSKETIQQILSYLPCKNPKIKSIQIIKLTRKSYSMLTDEDEQEERLYDIIIDLSENSSNIVYIDETGEPVEIESELNAITILKANPYFYRYQNHKQSDKLFIKIQVV
jgi:hypothetical protein